MAFSGAQAPTYPTAAGSRGTADTARDVRDFAVKFYTPEGNYDLVGNNMPVFFIQDAIKSPDLIHAVKPEPNSEMPQAASAHDTFWDFVTLMPESTHMLMWIMSDRAIPRSLRMMEGIGVRTFRFVNAAGVSHFVKFHRKPKLGLHAPAWDEAQVLACKDPDFHRRDLWEAIDHGDFPRWELGVQVVAEADEHGLDFDLLDATKLIPEERVPLRPIGRMVLNHKPDNFFAETEQVAFHPGHVVPGIDFSNDPLLQGRLSSCIVTQLRCRLPGLALGLVCSADGASLSVEGTLIITPSVMIDALYRPDRGAGELCLTSHGDAVHFVLEGFKHCNTISAFGSGCALLASLRVACPSTPDVSQPMAGLVLSGAGPLPPEFESVFMAQIGQHRHWARQHLGAVPA